MTDNFLPFSRPSISEQEITAVADVLRSGWITTGANTAEFEKQFAQFTGNQTAIALSSATAGMHLLLHACGIGSGDEVITPSMTWVSTVNLITLCGARPVFVDIDKDTLMTTAAMIEPLITEKTRLIIPVHFAGAALDLDALYALGKKYNIPVIEDAAHAAGTYYKEKHVGSQGTAIYSFHPIKNMTTGEGGMFCTNDEALGEKIRRLKFHGLGVDAFDRHTQGRSPQAEVLEPGFKYNMTDLSSILGMGQLKQLPVFNQLRTKVAGQYLNAFKNIKGIEPLHIPHYPMQHAWHLFIVRINEQQAGMDRNEFMQRLKENNIGSGLHFRAVHEQKYYRQHLPAETGSLANTEYNSQRICSLPLFPAMQDNDVNQVIETIERLLANK
jgi:UDP-4-amino-4-deoxy-L-arabinose-oxoglutarate aminotransferase